MKLVRRGIYYALCLLLLLGIAYIYRFMMPEDVRQSLRETYAPSKEGNTDGP